MNSKNIIVLKFGSSVLRSEAYLPNAVHEIYRHWREGAQVIAVVSAFGDTTDQLTRRAETLCAEPDRSALATLLATGEAASSALLGLALNRSGISSRVLDPMQAGLRTMGSKLDADPIAVDAARLLAESRRAVVVLPGFVGRGEQGDTTLLGRGGSDFSALFLAHHLRANCILIKDVEGLYTSDPAGQTVRGSRFEQASYETALRLGGSVVQHKAVLHRLLIVSISRVPHLTLSEWPCWVAARLAEECLKDCRPYRSCFRSLASARAVLVAHAPPVFPILYLLLILKRWLSSLVMWWWS